MLNSKLDSTRASSRGYFRQTAKAVPALTHLSQTGETSEMGILYTEGKSSKSSSEGDEAW